MFLLQFLLIVLKCYRVPLWVVIIKACAPFHDWTNFEFFGDSWC